MDTTYFADIRTAVINAVKTSKNIKHVYGHEGAEFAGIPASIVVPTDNQSEYNSSANDKLTYVFKIVTYYQIKEGGVDWEKAEEALIKVIDELTSIFRSRVVLGSACDWLTPVPSVWGYEERGAGVYRTAELTLRCIKYAPKL